LNVAVKPDFVKPRWSKVLADLWGSKLRTFLVVASIAVGVFSIGMIISAYAILAEDVDRSYASALPVNIEIWTDPFYEDFIRIIERVPGIDVVEGRQVISVRTSVDGIEWQNMNLIAVNDFESMEINRLSTLAGTQYPGHRELLVSMDFLTDSGYQVGDIVQVELANGSIHSLPLVGIVADQVTNAGDFTAGPTLYMTMDSLGSLNMYPYYNRLFIKVSGEGGDKAEIKLVANIVEDKIKHNHRQVYRTHLNVSTSHPLRSLILAVLGVLGALGGLITFLSGALIINTFNALLTQHMRQIGVMKLIGGRSYQIMALYVVLIIAYGLMALLVALPAGAVAGYALSSYLASTMNAVLQGFRIIPAAIITQTLVALIIPISAGFFPIRKGAKTNVRRALSNNRIESQATGFGWLNRVSHRIRIIPRPILLSIRNTFRQTGRLLLTLFTLTVAGAMFIAVFNVRTSMSDFTDQLSMHFLGDVTLNFNQPYPISAIEKVVMAIPSVRSIEGWGIVRTDIWDDNDDIVETLQIIAPPADTNLLDPDLVDGRWLLPGEEKTVVVADSIYEYYPELQSGDTIRVKVPGQQVEEWKVAGVFRFINMAGDYILAYADYDFIARLLDLPNQAYAYRIITTEHTLDEQKEVVRDLNDYLSARDFQISSIRAGLNVQEENSRAIDILVVFLLIMALLTAFVGSIGLTGTMGMNILERTREIGVMRAVGAVDGEIFKSVVVESLVIGFSTWALAIGVSFPISELLLKIISESMMGSALDLSFTSEGVGIWLFAVVGLSFVSSIIPARNATRLTIHEVLAYE
jgi:putative ABC transport system permease protein